MAPLLWLWKFKVFVRDFQAGASVAARFLFYLRQPRLAFKHANATSCQMRPRRLHFLLLKSRIWLPCRQAKSKERTMYASNYQRCQP